MKIALFVVLFFGFSGIAHTQNAGPIVGQVPRLNIFSADRLAAEVSRAQASGASAQREPTFTKEKLSRPTVIAGLGLMTIGAVLAATAGESATMTTFNPITQQPITSTVSVTNSGRRWVGIGMLGGGGVLTYLGLTE